MEQERPSFYQGKGCQTLLIVLGVVMVIGFYIFNILTYLDSSRVDPTPYEAARWRSLIFGLLLFFARVFLFCMAAAAKDGKVVRVVTWIIQGLCVVLCALSLLVFLWLTNGRYTKETINLFTEFKAIIAFLALTQGGVQRIFLNGHKIVSMLSGKQMEAESEGEGSRIDVLAIGQCIFKIVGCVLLLDLARWFCLISLTRWWRTLLTMSGF